MSSEEDIRRALDAVLRRGRFVVALFDCHDGKCDSTTFAAKSVTGRELAVIRDALYRDVRKLRKKRKWDGVRGDRGK
ncbi:MAG: hypothetical protein GWO40_22000 [Gammaproteobacteria bacterium]|nr:hypothetical protein [Gammaproteobacteria bacterium]NIV53840.1 hypothetical protein [Gammaproteobacteria bacterium]NIX88183.1 hypothetical protein [Gammaproteobacteria bacterium]